ncbi:hypothetical protein A1F94_013910 [Pyrenophora tritici-repentis]|nr:hypothetical protein A1F94_013910 [Pyrenophora tritici-repentis]
MPSIPAKRKPEAAEKLILPSSETAARKYAGSAYRAAYTSYRAAHGLLNRHVSLYNNRGRPRRASPLPILAASQASRLTDEPAWESQLMFDKPEDSIVQPLAFSSAATEASVEEDSAVSVDFRDFEGVDWSRLKDELYFVCKYCHIHKLPNGVHRVTKSTTAANGHLQLDKPGHRLSKDGPILSKPLRKHGQQSLRQAALSGETSTYKISAGSCALAGRQQQTLREFETPAFRKMIRLANPEAEAALWRSHNSVSAKGAIVDLPIALPQLVGAHTGEAIADAVTKILQSFSINRSKLGYFVLDNAYNNDTAVNKLAAMDADAYNNALENTKMEDFYMKEWRKEGPLGVYLDIINYINTPKHGGTREPIKPCVTRWNSYYDCFKRGVQLQQAINAYATNKLPDVPRWMRSDGLTAADWAVITEYMAILQPLKFATDRLRPRQVCGFGALYEVIPVFERATEALRKIIPINLRAEAKSGRYFTKILQSHLLRSYGTTRYKTYSKRFWRDDKLHNFCGFGLPTSLPLLPQPTAPKPTMSSFDDAIDAILDEDGIHWRWRMRGSNSCTVLVIVEAEVSTSFTIGDRRVDYTRLQL